MNPVCTAHPGCVRSSGHTGSHLTTREGLVLDSVTCYPMPTNIGPMCALHVDRGSAWINGACELYGPRPPIPDPTNKPAYKRLIQKGVRP